MVVTRQWHIIERRRIVYEPEPTRFIYHHASTIAPDMAQVLIETARAQTVEKARREIDNLLRAAKRRGTSITAAGAPAGNNRLPGDVSQILAAHARIHAEGAFYRDLLADACGQLELGVKRTPERDLWAVAGKAFGCGDTELRDRLDALRKEFGPPC